MTDLIAKRTLVKSPPELWAELSEVASLARHLGEFGEIRITRTEPESTVAWEGEHVSGTVELEESGWGTKVTLRAAIEAEQAEPEAPEPEPAAPEPAAPLVDTQPTMESPALIMPEPPAPSERHGFLSRWRRRRRDAVEPERLERRSEPVMAAAISDGALSVVERGRLVPRPVEALERNAAPERAPEPAPSEPAASKPGAPPPALDLEQALTVLETTLDSLGSAHHRPFSRG